MREGSSDGLKAMADDMTTTTATMMISSINNDGSWGEPSEASVVHASELGSPVDFHSDVCDIARRWNIDVL